MSEPEMKVDPARAKALASQLQEVQQRITAVAKDGRPVSFGTVQAHSLAVQHQQEGDE